MRYDVVVVGAGSAGCVLANRLSADPRRSVLLLEAGPGRPEPPGVVGPCFFDALASPGWMWPDVVVRRAAEQEPRLYQRGRGLGGSSAVNALVAIPGIPDDYAEWERLGATGWGWAELAPRFATTSLTLNPAPEEEIGHVSSAVRRALPMQSMAVPLTRDRAGRRISAAEAYLGDAVLERANLTVRTDAHVERLLIQRRAATGVRLVGGEEIEAAEVVVSCGAIHTPQLLLRSGVDTPDVGEGLKDHASLPAAIMLRESADVHSLPISVVARMSSGEEPADLQLLPMDHLGETAPGLGLLMLALMKVHSVGRVTEDSIDFDMLSDERDIRRLRAGIALLERLAEHPAIAALGDLMIPDISTDAALRANLGDYVHAASTCAIGRVVDTDCRLIGYDGLRACDASVMPDLPRANTHLTTVVIAEHLAARWTELD